MQTFLPFESFAECARVLDSARLNKQISECTQIMRAALGLQNGYAQHPCVLQWSQNLGHLRQYQHEMHDEWRRRFGHHASAVHKSFAAAGDLTIGRGSDRRFWISNECQFLGKSALHRSHREMLLSKDFNYYAHKFNYPSPPIDPYYIWWSPTLGFYRIERDYYQQLVLT